MKVGKGYEVIRVGLFKGWGRLFYLKKTDFIFFRVVVWFNFFVGFGGVWKVSDCALVEVGWLGKGMVMIIGRGSC